MLKLCIGIKISPNLISPTARVAHQEVVDGALEWTRHARGLNIERTGRLINLSLLSSYMLFTTALASVMVEGDTSDNRGPIGSGKTWGATWKYDSTDIKLGYRLRRGFEYQVKT